MSTLVVIPARYGSQRLPGKPLADLHGRPMIQWVYEAAARAEWVGEVIVATDDERIRSAVERFGGKAAMTHPAARSGTDRVAEVAREHAANVVINVQGDEPLVHPEMVDQLAQFLQQHAAVPMASLMTPLQDPAELNNPNVVKAVVDRDGFALYFSRAPIPFVRANPPTRQPAHQLFKHLGIYGYQRDFLLRFPHLEPTPLEQLEQLEQLRTLEHGYRIKLLVTAHETISIDTPEDLERVRRHLERTGLTAGTGQA